jgi:hypothetical protein
MTVEGENQNTWEVSLKDGETAVVVGLLADGSVVAQISGTEKGNNAGQLVLWNKDKPAELLPWIPREECGSVESTTTDMSRYAAFATCDDRSDTGRWIVFDRRSPTPIVNRLFPKNARAALSPDGLHSSRCPETMLLAIGVGIVIAHDPLLGPGRALISASGSYLG